MKFKLCKGCRKRLNPVINGYCYPCKDKLENIINKLKEINK